MSTGEKIRIVHKVIFQMLPLKDVAKEFRISQQYVSILANKTRRNPKFLGDLIEEQERRSLEAKKVREAIEECLRQNGYLGSVKDIQKILEQDYELKIKAHRLLYLLHKELNMKYKRIEAISWKGNDPKNLILRQQFALAFLKLDLMNKTLVVLDESWIGMSDFRRMRWTPAGKPNSLPKKNLSRWFADFTNRMNSLKSNLFVDHNWV